MNTPSPADLAARHNPGSGEIPVTAGDDDRSLAPYHLYARARHSGWLDEFDDLLTKWLATKNRSTTPGVNLIERDENGSLSLLHTDGEDGHAVRAVLRENAPNGIWTTEAVAVERPDGAGWLSLRTSNSEGVRSAIPRLARSVIETVDLTIDRLPLTHGAMRMDHTGVPGLMDALLSTSRRAPVFVVATGTDGDLDAFSERVDKWARTVTGIAHVVLLSPSATEAFNATVGPRLNVHPWSMRTYRRPMRLDDPFSRHRILSSSGVASYSDRKIGGILERAARAQVNPLPIPFMLAEQRRIFGRIENEMLVAESNVEAYLERAMPSRTEQDLQAESDLLSDAAKRIAAASATAEEALDLVEKVTNQNRALTSAVREREDALRAAREEIDGLRAVQARRNAEVAARLADLQSENDALAQERDDLKGENDDLIVDFGEATERSEEAQRRERWAHQELAKLQSGSAFAVDIPVDPLDVVPSSFSELMDRADELAALGVVITADRKTAEGLDDHDIGSSVMLAWSALLTLVDYRKACQSGDHAAGVDGYLKETPPGMHQFAPSKHAAWESEGTMNRYGQERLLPVPAEVDPSEKAFMEAHFRLGHVAGTKAPRMHYLDDLEKTGRIYVGYIGPHLRNQQTN